MKVPFDPPPGIFPDDTSYSNAGRWQDCNNVRFYHGRPQPIGYYTLVTSLGGATPGVIKAIHHWRENDGDSLIGIGTSTKVFVRSGTTNYNITPASGYAAADNLTVALQNFGELLLINPEEGKLFVWEGDTGTAATEVTNAPDAIQHILVTQERQVLALGCNEESSGTFNPRCIRGSDLETYDDWTTSSTNNAFEHILDDAGRIVAGRQIGPYVAVWTDRSLFLGQFIGDPGQTYRFDKVATNCGLIGCNAVAVAGQTAYWLTPDSRIMSWSPGGLPAMIESPLTQSLTTSTGFGWGDRQYKGIVFYNSLFNEMWFFYKESGSGTADNTDYIALSLVDNSWFKGDLGRSACATVFDNFIYMANEDDIYRHETEVTTDTLAAWSITSADQLINRGDNEAMITRIEPDVDNGNLTDIIHLSLKVRNRPYRGTIEETTKGPYSVNTTTKKIDMRATARIFRVHFASTSPVAFARIGKTVFEATVLGKGR